jgi:CRP-like cAMP-binding protein
VLLGVAAEELLEQLYESIGAHLPDSSDYRSKLNTKRWASQRLQYARERLRQHLTEFDRDFESRVDQYLDMLAQILKLSRDDVGHARPLRIDREIASMNLLSFPVLAGIVNELMSHLAQPCIIAARNGRKA